MINFQLPEDIYNAFHRGVVIPALPLVLDKNRKHDVRRQRALMRYYLDCHQDRQQESRMTGCAMVAL